jgi:hypothetical protein
VQAVPGEFAKGVLVAVTDMGVVEPLIKMAIPVIHDEHEP